MSEFKPSRFYVVRIQDHGIDITMTDSEDLACELCQRFPVIDSHRDIVMNNMFGGYSIEDIFEEEEDHNEQDS